MNWPKIKLLIFCCCLNQDSVNLEKKHFIKKSLNDLIIPLLQAKRDTSVTIERLSVYLFVCLSVYFDQSDIHFFFNEVFVYF